jgi:hypothetical protein
VEGDSPSSHLAIAALLVVVVVRCSIIRILQYRHDSCPCHPIGLPPVRPAVVVEPSTLKIKKPRCKFAGKMAFFSSSGRCNFFGFAPGWFLVVDWIRDCIFILPK